MAFVYSTTIQNRISQAVFGVPYATLIADQKSQVDGTWTSGSLTTGTAFDALTRIEQIANYFEMAGATSAPQSWEHWLVYETAAMLAKIYRPERVQAMELEREKSIDTALDTFTLRDPTGAFSSANDSQKITVQGIRYFCLNHGSRRKESGVNTGMRRRLFFPIDEIDSHLQWVLNYVYNKEQWSFRKRDVLVTINYIGSTSGVSVATWTEASKTLTQTGAFTNLNLTNGTAMLQITSGTGAAIGEYQIATKTSSNAITLTTSLSTANADLGTGDIVGNMFYLDIRGMLATETIDAVASRRFYYQNGNGRIGANARLNWIDSTGMSAAKAYNITTQGQPGVFRIENQPSGVRSWRLAPFPDSQYFLNGAVYVTGPGTPTSVSDTSVFDKFPVEFGVIIRDMTLARLLQYNRASDADLFWSRAVESVQTLLPAFVDQGSQTRLQTPDDVYNDMASLIGGNSLIWGGSGGFGGYYGGIT